MGASGSINFLENSGSHYDAQPGDSFVQKILYHKSVVDFSRISTTTVVEELTIKYFQRVWDIDNSQWCYYTKTSIDATPGTSDTQPTNSGNITSASVVQILEIY